VSDEPVAPSQPNNPLHGVTLRQMLDELSVEVGWARMAREIKVRCFENEPSVESSLKFLRRTPWARQRVEHMYLRQLSRRAGRPASAGPASPAALPPTTAEGAAPSHERGD
jgi:uncharacterized protein (DUF2132 family)